MLLNKIIEGIEMVKEKDISVLNLKNRNNFICDYFVICDGKSKSQVYAIYRSIEKITIEKLKEKPWHIEGSENGEWILIDYVSIVVHIFKKELRLYYNLESIWNEKL
ncbi:ribosome silencing factor [Blattabacterium sp. (Cryptocercus kyebangensis)]|uniref:ribosome silencing factor n=1 Tax=Blattabacterium sp. (Cryptocercus kyebangensis) TaxID=298656 RepID=UPI000D7BE1C6|nr:ribosome silencing factor [Blattabacterium sp. (Cryptocercus kyebangensis)]AWU43661.1 ribosome silencing factor [Blattabacterium sp. (Cryptocercus kyebangensis)]